MASLDSFIANIGMSKSASAPAAGRSSITAELLAKLASDVGAPNLADNPAAAAAAANSGEATGVPGTPVVGQVLNAGGATVAQPAPATVAATDALANPQVQAAGGDVAAMAQGSAPAVGTVEPVRVSDGAGTINENLAIVNSVTNGAPVSAEKTASLVDAVERGRIMARGYADEIQKVANAQAFNDAHEFLKSAGVYAYFGYDMGEEKTASAAPYSALEKMASGAALSYADIISAADEYANFQQANTKAEVAAEKIASDIIDAAADRVADSIVNPGAAADTAADAAAKAALASNAGATPVESAAHAAAAAVEHVEDKVASAPLDLNQAIAVLRAAGKIQ